MKMRMIGWKAIGVVSLGLALAALVGCGQGDSGGAESAVEAVDAATDSVEAGVEQAAEAASDTAADLGAEAQDAAAAAGAAVDEAAVAVDEAAAAATAAAGAAVDAAAATAEGAVDSANAAAADAAAAAAGTAAGALDSAGQALDSAAQDAEAAKKASSSPLSSRGDREAPIDRSREAAVAGDPKDRPGKQEDCSPVGPSFWARRAARLSRVVRPARPAGVPRSAGSARLRRTRLPRPDLSARDHGQGPRRLGRACAAQLRRRLRGRRRLRHGIEPLEGSEQDEEHDGQGGQRGRIPGEVLEPGAEFGPGFASSFHLFVLGRGSRFERESGLSPSPKRREPLRPFGAGGVLVGSGSAFSTLRVLRSFEVFGF
jgi:hypothetical protein